MSKMNSFEKIGQAESRSLLREAALTKATLNVISEELEVSFKAKGAAIKGESLFLAPPNKSIQGTNSYLINFVLNDQKYFVKCECEIQNGFLSLLGTFNLYRLRRRYHVRIDIDNVVIAKFLVKHINQDAVDFEANIIDLSAGGVRFDIPTSAPVFKVGDILKGSLKLSYRSDIDIAVEVRNVAPGPSENSQTVGSKFVGHDAILESRIFKVVMSVAEEINKKKSQTVRTVKKVASVK